MTLSKEIPYETPREARQNFRQGKHSGCSLFGLFPGYFQANIAIISEEYAGDFRKFCDLNQSCCPVVYQSKTGEYSADLISTDSDIRSDLTLYQKFKDSLLEKSVGNLKDQPWDKMVTFYLGCSFSFDSKLTEAGINLDTNANVSMYLSNIKCREIGPFNTNMVVSMRPIPKSLLQKAYETTINLAFCHGAPIHIGYPKDIEIDLENPTFGSKTTIPLDHVPVFWACGVTSSEAVKNARLPFSFSHAPGCMYVSDIKSDNVTSITNFKTYSKPKVVCLNSQLEKYSVISEKSWELLDKIELEVFEDVGKRGIQSLLVKEDYHKAVLSLSKHSTSVGILLGFPCFQDHVPFEENDGIGGAIYIAKALTKLGKQVTFFIDQRSTILKNFLEDCQRKGFSSTFTSVKNIDASGDFSKLLFDENSNLPKYSHLIAIERPCRAKCGKYHSMKGKDISDRSMDPLDLLFEKANQHPDITTIGIGDGGNEVGMGKVYEQIVATVPNGDKIASAISCDYLITAGVSDWGGFGIAAGLFIARQCEVHDRFRTFGITHDEPTPTVDDVIFNEDLDEKLRYDIRDKGFRDGITGDIMTVDGMSYENVHIPKLKKIRNIAKLAFE